VRDDPIGETSNRHLAGAELKAVRDVRIGGCSTGSRACVTLADELSPSHAIEKDSGMLSTSPGTQAWRCPSAPVKYIFIMIT
jgi:hypothetical protein